MNTLREHIEIKEDLQESVGEMAAAAIVGIPTVGLLAAWGTTLILYGYSKGARGVYNIFKRATENFSFKKVKYSDKAE